MAGEIPASKSSGVELEGDDDYWPLSGKPFFDVVVAKTHLHPKYTMFLPVKVQKDLSPGPCTKPAVLTYRGKNWYLSYQKGNSRHWFRNGWKEFATDNDLKVGDACVFEVFECSSSQIKFKVQILRDDFPKELLRNIQDDGETLYQKQEDGETPDTAIFID